MFGYDAIERRLKGLVGDGARDVGDDEDIVTSREIVLGSPNPGEIGVL
jgi:hypothetical protein